MTDLLLVAGPATLFGIKIQIDTGNGISRMDYPRMAVWGIGWFELIAMYFDTLISIPTPKTLGVVSLQTYSVVSKLFLVQALNFVGINIRMAHNISGMLSSSFQGST